MSSIIGVHPINQTSKPILISFVNREGAESEDIRWTINLRFPPLADRLHYTPFRSKWQVWGMSSNIGH